MVGGKHTIGNEWKHGIINFFLFHLLDTAIHKMFLPFIKYIFNVVINHCNTSLINSMLLVHYSSARFCLESAFHLFVLHDVKCISFTPTITAFTISIIALQLVFSCKGNHFTKISYSFPICITTLLDLPMQIT